MGAVARRLGVAAPTLRSWGRRYGLEPSGRSDGGHRRYTAADVARLQVVLRLVRQGVPTATAAEAVRGTTVIPELTLRADVRSPHRDVAFAVRDSADRQRLVRTLAERMDALPLQAAVDGTLAAEGAAVTWTDLLAPLLAASSAESSGESEVDRFLVEVAAGCLHRYAGQVWVRRPPDPAARPVLLAALPGEPHPLPLLAMAAVLAERQVLGQVLGAGVPADVVAAAVTRCRPVAVCLWAGGTAAADVAALGGLVRGRPAYPMVAAGPGWPVLGPSSGPRRRLRRALHLPDACTILTATSTATATRSVR